MTSESDMIDLKARSREGRGLSQKAGEHWIEIQKNTFMNWVNLQLHGTGLIVTDFEIDFDDGVKLCALVEALQSRKIGRVIKKPLNQHQSLENVTLALRAIAEDGVRLVNIGSEDIVNGSLKLILGLVWHLILRYQIGKTKFPPKKLMLAWLQAVIPECHITNFTSDWNDGVALHALIEYCQPGLCPTWRQLSRSDRFENCKDAIHLANDKLGVPIVVRPEDFCSPHLDDLSGMTYLSYYMNVDSPGYFATRREIRTLLQDQAQIENFSTDWNDGMLLCTLVKCVGGEVDGWPSMSSDSERNLQNGVDGARALGIEPIFSAKEMSDPEVEHLGIMAYAAYFRKFQPVRVVQARPSMSGNFDDVYVQQEKHFKLNAGASSPSSMRAEVVGPTTTVPVNCQWDGDRCDCYFTPTETGQHNLNVYSDDENIPGCPVPFRVNSDRSKILYEPLERAVVGMNSTLKVDTHSAGQGEIRIEAHSPSGRVQTLPVMYHNEGVHAGNFVPNEVGDWTMNILYDGEHVQGSPYTVKVFDPSLVRITDLNSGKVGHELSFHADASAAGEGAVTCDVYHHGEKVPCYLTRSSDDKYTVDFTPQGAGTYQVHAFMNDIEVKGSPYTVDIIDSSRVTVTGEGLSLVPVNTPAVFTVQAHGAGGGKVDVDITAPSGRHVPCTVTRSGGRDQEYLVQYMLQEIGEYTIEVKFAEQEITGSPFMTKAYDSRKLVVSDMPTTASRNVPVVFHIDASQAGSGNIEIRVNEGRVPCSVENRGDHRFTASFVPENSKPHKVEMTFNDSHVEGSPWTIHIVDHTAIKLKGEDRIPCHKKATVHIQPHGQSLAENDLDAVIQGPTNQNVPYNLSSDSSGDTVVTYIPTDVGDYTIRVKYGEHDVSGSPFTAKAYNTGAIIVTPLNDGFVNQPMYFTIDVGEAGEGQLQIMVNNGNIPNEVDPQEPGKYRIKFIPTEPGMQQVDIHFNDHALPCSPLTCVAQDLSATIVGLTGLIPVQTESSFRVQSQAQISNVASDVVITAPNGGNIPARLVQQPDGDYKVEWTPAVPGRHSIDVLFGGKQVQGSPFYIDVFDIHKIRVNYFYNGDVNEKAGFKVDCSQAGQGNQEIRIVSPSGREVPCDIEETTPLEYNVSYTPTEAGQHKIHISYSNMELNGSPFHQEISEGVLPPVHGDGLYKGEEDKPATFFIDARGIKGEPQVQVDGPNAIAKCSIDPQSDGQYKVTYIPVEVGLFDVNVRWNGKELPGSPFHPQVVDARKVKVVGGWQHYMDGNERIHLVVGEEKRIPFDTSEAGPGQLRAEVQSPSSFLPVRVEDEIKGKSVVVFTPREEGNHSLNLYWSDHRLVNSPYPGYATSGVADPSKVWLTGRGLKEAVVREEAEFVIDGSQAGPGEPDVELTGVRAEIQVITTPLGGGKFRCTYIPVIPGAYLLNISWNGRQLRGAPYKVNVIGASYPNRVVVTGDGLRGGLLGHSLDFRIDTRKAGPGELTAYCMGPTQVAYCELSDHHDGTYRLVVRPQETGRHVLQIKYGGEHVQGSPFAFKVSAQPDASKVRVSGPGVEHGILANFQSQFIVETRGAGAGQLTVRIRGPKGAFQVEMYRESQKDRTILCRYYPSVTGLYIINVRWSGVDVPGSPFHVHILDTHHELEQVLHEQSFGSGGGGQHHQHQLHHNNTQVQQLHNSFHHNTSMNSSHHNSSFQGGQGQGHQQVQRFTTPVAVQQQNGGGVQHHHHVTRSSGHYQWREDM